MSKPMIADSKLEGILLPRCALCENVPEQGIRGGYLINKSFICSGCEKKIIDTEVGSPAYQSLLEMIKRIIR